MASFLPPPPSKTTSNREWPSYTWMVPQFTTAPGCLLIYMPLALLICVTNQASWAFEFVVLGLLEQWFSSCAPQTVQPIVTNLLPLLGNKKKKDSKWLNGSKLSYVKRKKVVSVLKALYASIFCIACNNPILFRLTRAGNNNNETNDSKTTITNTCQSLIICKILF